MDAEKALLAEVFGESSDDENSEEKDESTRSFERVEEVKGLWICRDFLSPQQHSSLLSAIQNEGWFSEASNNQAMRFGDLPPWATELSDLIHAAALSNYRDDPFPFPSELLSRKPLFDQLIANLYRPGEGISAHVDLMRFEDGIAIVSLESSCVMHFSRVGGRESDRVPVHLSAGSLVVMAGEARYLWKHEINRKPGFQEWKGRELVQRTRISITLRKLCQLD